MATIKWKKEPEPKPEEQRPDAPEGQEPAILPLAKELAEAAEGRLVAVYDDARRPGTMCAVIAVEEDTSLMVVDMPASATSLDEVPEEGTHYCTGLDLMTFLHEDGGFKSEAGMRALGAALTSFDRQRSVRIATGWMKFTLQMTPPAT